MSRFLLPAGMAAAFVALMGVSQAVKAIEVGEPIRVAVVCDKNTVEGHLALIQEDPRYGLAREQVQADIAAGKCVRVPGVPVAVLEKGRVVRLVDGDGDHMEFTVVRVADGAWTISAYILGKEG